MWCDLNAEWRDLPKRTLAALIYTTTPVPDVTICANSLPEAQCLQLTKLHRRGDCGLRSTGLWWCALETLLM
ncbi:hypothetical protein AALO_G00018510 [Alosa alosa]|uniref:Uncharacterized protein n=1 Tax=Alosa alosa TaxID=278164 RepID=A0AAV6HI76_9TELE|nr:hypothetical protein AALO_G00018510 [Alosa alosa]